MKNTKLLLGVLGTLVLSGGIIYAAYEFSQGLTTNLNVNVSGGVTGTVKGGTNNNLSFGSQDDASTNNSGGGMIANAINSIFGN